MIPRNPIGNQDNRSPPRRRERLDPAKGSRSLGLALVGFAAKRFFAEIICFYNVFACFSVACFRTLSVPNAMLDPHCNSIPPQQGNHDFPLIFK